MKKCTFFLVVLLSLFILSALATTASACRQAPPDCVTTCFDVMYGDADHMGATVHPDAGFSWRDVLHEADDVAFTDRWGYDSIQFNLDVPVDSIDYASLVIGHGGDGVYGQTKVFLNDTFLGFLTDGDLPGTTWYNAYFEDCFPAFGLMPGENTIKLVLDAPNMDGWVLDYARVNGVGKKCNSVPEPATLLLLGTSLVMLGGVKKKFKS